VLPPTQIAEFVELAVTVGNALMVNKNVVGELVPQVLPAVTVTLPDVEPAVTLMLVVPCPELITVPAGTVHVYVVAPTTGAMEYVVVAPVQTADNPLIEAGCAGAPAEVEYVMTT
jgi:hypothetical protein